MSNTTFVSIENLSSRPYQKRIDSHAKTKTKDVYKVCVATDSSNLKEKVESWTGSSVTLHRLHEDDFAEFPTRELLIGYLYVFYTTKSFAERITRKHGLVNEAQFAYRAHYHCQ